MSTLIETMKAQAALASIPQVSTALTQVEQQRAEGELKSKIFLAKQFPRVQHVAVQEIIQACTRLSLAEKGLYSYSRGGADITGPSIRLAEAIAQSWGNIDYGFRELEQRIGMNGIKESHVQTYAWDMQTNTSQHREFTVRHWRSTKQGGHAIEDPRDVYEHIASQAQRRTRACILGIIPGDVTEEAVEQCQRTLVANVTADKDAMPKMLAAFAEMGVTREMIEKKILRKIDAIKPTQIVNLRAIYNSIKDGMSKPPDWFEMQEQESDAGKSATTAIKEKLAKKAKEAKESEEEPTSSTTPDPEPAQLTLRGVLGQIKFLIDTHKLSEEQVMFATGVPSFKDISLAEAKVALLALEDNLRSKNDSGVL